MDPPRDSYSRVGGGSSKISIISSLLHSKNIGKTSGYQDQAAEISEYTEHLIQGLSLVTNEYGNIVKSDGGRIMEAIVSYTFVCGWARSVVVV